MAEEKELREEPKEADAAASAQASDKRKRRKMVITRGKRKEAIARASIKEGNGKIYINGRMLSSYDSPFLHEVVNEPLNFVTLRNFDIHINVHGGGFSGQAQAARTAIARAIVKFTKDDKLKAQFTQYDRSFLVEDPRRVEPKKFKGPKARARFTKSYR
ncbi:MAG TPA: 30S ribosomal protein S9 [Candidatus Norongarragalinales archaeon]|nr:30S ribosomal protein S9 [Candidatus Norongarragalinales archaeon]